MEAQMSLANCTWDLLLATEHVANRLMLSLKVSSHLCEVLQWFLVSTLFTAVLEEAIVVCHQIGSLIYGHLLVHIP